MLGYDLHFLFILSIIQRLNNEWFENFFHLEDGNHNNIKSIVLKNHDTIMQDIYNYHTHFMDNASKI